MKTTKATTAWQKATAAKTIGRTMALVTPKAIHTTAACIFAHMLDGIMLCPRARI